jgi:hypothetical protein
MSTTKKTSLGQHRDSRETNRETETDLWPVGCSVSYCGTMQRLAQLEGYHRIVPDKFILTFDYLSICGFSTSHARPIQAYFRPDTLLVKAA